MENVNKLIQMVFSGLVFCLGILLMFYEVKTYSGMLRTTREMFKENEIYQQYNESDMETVAYSELIATLLNPIDYDIRIDGFIIRKNEHSNDRINEYSIPIKDYSKSYRYDEDGNIIMIIYTGLS